MPSVPLVEGDLSLIERLRYAYKKAGYSVEVARILGATSAQPWVAAASCRSWI